MARQGAPSDPAQPVPGSPPPDHSQAIVPVMVCAWDGRLLVLTSRGWQHRQGVLAATVPLTRLEVARQRSKGSQHG